MDFKTDLLEHEFFRTVLMLSQLKGWQRGLTNNSLQVRHLKNHIQFNITDKLTGKRYFYMTSEYP